MKKRHALLGGIACIGSVCLCILLSQGIPTVNADAVATSSEVAEPTRSPAVAPSEPLPAESVLETEPEPTPPVFEEYEVSLMAVGDNLMHMGIVNTGKQKDGTYNYDFLFRPLSEFLAIADVKVINQETILGGDSLGFSGFPRFNSPTQVGDSIANAGFNVVLHATNHAADQNKTGIVNCLEFWKQYPAVTVAGIHEENDFSIPVITVKNVTFAILNYTYGPNAGTIPKSYRNNLNLLCAYNESNGQIDFTTLNPRVIEDIQSMDKEVDYVVVFPHWGTEYQSVPSSYQEEFAREMTEAGADIIIGAHPHMPQPVEWIEAENGNKSLCYYSLGNYVSTQKKGLCMLEEMAWVSIHVTENGSFLNPSKTGVIPMVCHYTSGPVRLEQVYLLEDYSEEKAKTHGIRNYGGVILKYDDLVNWSREIFGDWILKKEDVLDNIHL